MSNNNGPDHVVVDGSNIATEGRSLPSLKQLQEAVMSFMEEHPDAAVTVVVDATFGHRIDKSEAKEFEEGISNNELVAPPAGAVGRGDAFVLGIADKAGASVLSNDSFQEFHGEYEWLFDEGRLIGGKPVPHVGWVWVDRVPVRGPVSRKATGGRRGRSGGRSSSRSKSSESVRTGSKEAAGPMPVPKSPPPTKRAAAKQDDSDTPDEKQSKKRSSGRRSRTKKAAATTATDGDQTSTDRSPKSAPKGGEAVNDLMPFLDFVEHHPTGSEVRAVVDAYSSHGAYVDIVDTEVRGYVPLRLMSDPPPRSAKQVMKIGDEVDLVVVSFVADRRSIDCAVPAMADEAIVEADDEAPAKKSPAKKSAAKKSAAKKSAAKKSAAKKSAAKKSPAKKSAAKKSPAKKSAAKKSAAKKSPAKKSAAKKSPAKKSAAKKSAVKKSPAKKSAAKKSAAKKSAAKKSPARRAPRKKSAAERPSATGASGADQE